MKTGYIIGGAGIIGCISVIFFIILIALAVIIISFALRPINITPHVQLPKVDMNVHTEPPKVTIHPRQSEFKCSNCNAHYWMMVNRRISYKCPNCGHNTLRPVDVE